MRRPPAGRSQQRRKGKSDYERFAEYLHVMHQKALELRDSLNDNERSLLGQLIGGEKEHYWTAKKLFCHAMYIPMFLQIGRKHFDSLIYIDTHAGPGLARIGSGGDELILGSPLIALYWPRVVADRVPGFSRIVKGFDKLYFIEADPRNASLLRKFSSLLYEKHAKGLIQPPDPPVVEQGDANGVLRRVLRELDESGKILIYAFVDPLGRFDSQLSYEALRLLASHRVDLMLNVLTSSLARALSRLKKENRSEYRRRVQLLFGDLCEEQGNVAICDENRKSVRYNDIVDAYSQTLKMLGFSRVEVIPVQFSSGTIYHLLLAAKKEGEWIDGYVRYIDKKAPRSYEELRRVWLRVAGKQEKPQGVKTLDEYLSTG